MTVLPLPPSQPPPGQARPDGGCAIVRGRGAPGSFSSLQMVPLCALSPFRGLRLHGNREALRKEKRSAHVESDCYAPPRDPSATPPGCSSLRSCLLAQTCRFNFTRSLPEPRRHTVLSTRQELAVHIAAGPRLPRQVPHRRLPHNRPPIARCPCDHSTRTTSQRDERGVTRLGRRGLAEPAPTLSVFFPTWNEQDILRRTIRGAYKECRHLVELGQLADFELIIVDDASTDATGDIARGLAAESRRIRVVTHKVNRQLGGAIKSGIEAAQGDLVLYMDS